MEVFMSLRALFLVLVVTSVGFVACSKKDADNPAAYQPPAGSVVLQGDIYDPIMFGALSKYGYTKTTFLYTLNGDKTYSDSANVGFGFALVSKGTYRIGGDSVWFTPSASYYQNSAHVATKADSTLRPYFGLYNGAKDSLTIQNLGFMYKKDSSYTITGPLVLKKK